MFSDNGGPSYDDYWREQALRAWAEVKELRRDAERYRAVREHAARSPGAYQSWKHLEAEQFDAAIDAAIDAAMRE